MELGHAVFVLRLEDCKVVDALGVETAHGLNALEGAEPIEREKGFVGADAHNAPATKFGEVERIVRANGRIAVAGADEADGADGIGLRDAGGGAGRAERRAASWLP